MQGLFLRGIGMLSVRLARAASIALVGLFLTSCTYLPTGISTIGEITKSPSSFEGREVKLQGSVSPGVKIPLVDTKVYSLRDATGTIAVFSNGPMPNNGEEVIVRGKVDVALMVGGVSVGVSLKELERVSPLRMPWK